MRSILICLCLVVMPAAQAQSLTQSKDGSARIILLINALDDDLTHSHMGVTAFTNADNHISNNFGLPQSIATQTIRLLAPVSSNVVELSVDAGHLETIRSREYFSMGWSKPKLKADFAQWLRSEMTRYGASDAVMLIHYPRAFSPMGGPSYYGYGIMSMHGNPPKFAAIFANVSAIVISSNGMSVSRGARFRDSDCRRVLPAATTASMQLDKLSAPDLAPFRDEIEALAMRRVEQDLVESGLLPGHLRRCGTE